MPLPVFEMLASSPALRPAWALFDQKWYLQTYADARERCNGKIEAALDDYLSKGMPLGHSPSPLFDEKFYLSQNPDIVQLIQQGRYCSGFDHFCQYGHRIVSPHWLFDDQLYQQLYDDMSLENLDYHGCAGRYDHYLKSGQFEGRQCHHLFDAQFYQQQVVTQDISDLDIRVVGPFTHYLYCLSARSKELAPSIYFDPNWYLQNDFGVKLAIESRQFSSAIEHYLTADHSKFFDPVPEFSESYYIESNRDVSFSVMEGKFRCGYEHFIRYGTFELRRPHPKIDFTLYKDMNQCVSDDLNSGKIRDAFAHLRIIGIPRGLSHRTIDAVSEISEDGARLNLKNKALQNAILFAGKTLDFQVHDPAISLIMVAFNKFELTMLSLSSVRENFSGEIELILIDNGSSDQTRDIDKYLAGAKIFHLHENIGFLNAANIALEHVSAPVVLYLNNDVELGFGAISSALKTLYSSAGIGAVGGKIIRTHGKLQEAGSIIWNDGTAEGYMRDESPLRSEVNFIREVDYCSAVFLMVHRELLRRLNGFDRDFSPAYYEDSDLCLRLEKAGFKTLYDPKVVIYHFEYGSSEASNAAATLMKRGQTIFLNKHRDFLLKKYKKTPQNLIRARQNNQHRKILFIDDTLPLRSLGSGFVRTNDIVYALIQDGYDLSIFPINGPTKDTVSILSDLPDRAEILYDYDFMQLQNFLFERAGYYDLIWISRTHNLTRTLPLLKRAGISAKHTPIILDTEAIVTVRDTYRSLIWENKDINKYNFDRKLKEEFADARNCSHVIAVSPNEVSLLTGIDLPNVSLLGTVCEPKPTAERFSDRHGLLFVASIHHPDSPNLDSLRWFRDQIAPFLKDEMVMPPILNFVGYVSDKVDLSEFNSEQTIKIHGPVSDLSPYYNANRIFIAPTRFAAGTPYKMYEAASFGLPSVATDLLAEQLGWRHGVELLSASIKDARHFASQIALLYQKEELWVELRANAIRRLESENNSQSFKRQLQSIIDGVFARSDTSSPSLAARKRRAPGKSMPIG